MKKKGLIISTVVMAVVLIASLTTATYAWFSASASVSVSDMVLKTTAANGLEISVFSNSKYYSGTVSMLGGVLQSDIEDWGSEITFAETTESPHASTHLIWTKDADVDATTYKDGAHYELSSGAYKLISNEGKYLADGSDATFDGTKEYYTCAADTNSLPENMYIPTGYTTTQVPTGYEPAVNMTNFYYLPIRIRPTSNKVKQIMYRVVVTPNPENMNTNFYPGMAAASRITIAENSTKPTGSTVDNLEPFSNAEISGSAMVNTAASGAKFSSTDKYSYDGFIYSDGSTAIDAYTEFDFFFQLWIEGTDDECENKTAGSGLTVNIEFAWSDGTTMYALTNGVLDYTFENEAGSIHA